MSPRTARTRRRSSRAAPDGGKHSARYEVRDGDVPNFGGNERSENQGPTVVHGGDEIYWEFWVRFGDTTFPNPTSWFVAEQFHAASSTASPPIAINVQTNGVVNLGNNNDAVTHAIGTTDPGVWHKYVVHAKLTGSASTGWVEVWRDGSKVLNQTGMALLIPGDLTGYIKEGLYRDATHTSTQVVWHDGMRIWKV